MIVMFIVYEAEYKPGEKSKTLIIVETLITLVAFKLIPIAMLFYEFMILRKIKRPIVN